MKKLYYSTCSYATPHIGVVMNAIQNDLKEGHEVYFAYCDGICTSCFKNMDANAAKCKLCRITYHKCIFDKINGVKEFLPIKKSANSEKSVPVYSSLQELKNIEYKGVHVGLSILSLYFSITRNIEFDITPQRRKYFDFIINETFNLVDAAENLINTVDPDCITIYNGRYYENRAFYDLSQIHKLHFESLEVIGGFNEPHYPVKFTDCLPHDFHFFANKAKEIWRNAPGTDDEKAKIASAFYEKRRNGIVACDKVYTGQQIQGMLPELFEGKKNIVIFNSSSDEIAAIGGEWDSEQLFESQYECIKHLLSNLPKDCHIYLRIHPNLTGVNHKHHMDLYKLKDLSTQITIIPPADKISSYSLLDIADKVIVFGSTMGAEACYWGKPAILIGPAFYADLDLAYRPRNIKEIAPLLSADLQPKDKTGALYYSFYIQNRQERSESVNMKLSPTVHNLFGKKFKTFSYHTILGSTILYEAVEVFYREFLRRFMSDKNRMVK